MRRWVSLVQRSDLARFRVRKWLFDELTCVVLTEPGEDIVDLCLSELSVCRQFLCTCNAQITDGLRLAFETVLADLDDACWYTSPARSDEPAGRPSAAEPPAGTHESHGFQQTAGLEAGR